MPKGRSKMCLALCALAGFASLSVSGAALASSADVQRRIDEKAALTMSQAAIGNMVGNYQFRDSKGRPVQLADYLGKPLVVSLIYTGCTDICPTISESLLDGVKIARKAFGKDSFAVVTVGFDQPSDSPSRMHAFAVSRGINLDGWTMLSGSAETIDGLAKDIGFSMLRLPHGFDHLSQITVIGPDGRVFGQVYGATFEPPAFVEPLKRLIYGGRNDLTSVEGLLDRIRLVCTLYNPNTGRYEFDYSIFIAITGGSISLIAVAVVIVRGWLGQRRRRPQPTVRHT